MDATAWPPRPDPLSVGATAAGRCWSGAATFSGDVLPHLLVHQHLAQQPHDGIELQLAAPPIGVDLIGGGLLLRRIRVTNSGRCFIYW